jgi:hypothetical protein
MVRTSRRTVLVPSALVAATLLLSEARADEATPPPAAGAAKEIAWVQGGLPTAYARAKEQGKPLLIALNAALVDGGRPEPAGRELRENTYRDPAVVAKSAEFVCALLKPDGTSSDYGELRTRYGMQGQVVSPQHVFAYPDGSLIARHEYWPHAHGAPSVTALIALMETALAAHRSRLATPQAGAPDAAASEQRAAWIRDTLARVRRGSAEAPVRDAAIGELVKGDRKGDCIEPLGQVLVESKKDAGTQVAIVRALGKPGLEVAVAPVLMVLDSPHDLVRSNAAVTLEYIGSPRALEALTKRLPHEKDEVIANNFMRALGRCAVHAEAKKDGRVDAAKKVLLREMNAAKNDKAATGSIIGLAYFEKDADVARAVEKLAKKDGGLKRTFLLWTLTEIRDDKSADFVRKEILPNESRPYVLPFVQAVVAVLAGEDLDGSAKGRVEGGVGYVLSVLRGSIGGDARRGRDQSEFKPKGEIEPRGFGGRGPGGGGPGGAPGGMGG